MSDDLVTSVLTISLYDVAPSRYTYVSFMLDHAIFTKELCIRLISFR